MNHLERIREPIAEYNCTPLSIFTHSLRQQQ